MDMIMPGGLFVVDDSVTTIESAIKALAGLDLKWQVQSGTAPGAKSAIAVLERDARTGNIWAVAALEKNWSTHHRHNNEGGDYGEMIVTLGGLLPDKDAAGVPVSLTRGTIIYHPGGMEHQRFYSEFWVGLFNQPRGSTPLP
jgi:hypothetical protein